MGKDLSVEAKQTFQVVALLATVLVVGIHYKSDVPDSASPFEATWNQLAQEFLFGGIARVAVPLFAFTAGLFYFRSDDGSFATYRKKVAQRVRSVLVPFFLISSIAMVAWLLVHRLEGKPVEISVSQFLGMWLLHPPAVQLWFLRDLMVLVVAAPAIRLCGRRPIGRMISLAFIGFAWAVNWQIFPEVAGWRLLHFETLLFFVIGCFAVSHFDWIERLGRARLSVVLAAWTLWAALIIARIFLRADFEMWYVHDYERTSLLLHQGSILVGVATLFMTAWRMRSEWLLRLSGGSFFVYLIHEYPLRAVVDRWSDMSIDHRYSCWILAPAVIVGCYAAAIALARVCPASLAIFTGGRMPSARSRSAVENSAISVTPSRSL